MSKLSPTPNSSLLAGASAEGSLPAAGGSPALTHPATLGEVTRETRPHAPVTAESLSRIAYPVRFIPYKMTVEHVIVDAGGRALHNDELLAAVNASEPSKLSQQRAIDSQSLPSSTEEWKGPYVQPNCSGSIPSETPEIPQVPLVTARPVEIAPSEPPCRVGDAVTMLMKAAEGLYNGFEPDNQSKLYYEVDAFVRSIHPFECGPLATCSSVSATPMFSEKPSAWLIVRHSGTGGQSARHMEVVLSPLTDDTFMDEGDEAWPLHTRLSK